MKMFMLHTLTQGIICPHQTDNPEVKHPDKMKFKFLEFTMSKTKNCTTCTELARRSHAFISRTGSRILKRNSLKIVQTIDLTERAKTVCIKSMHRIF